MDQNTKTTEVLNDLIKINNDRIAGYEKAIEELSAADVDLKALFSSFVEQSQMLKGELQEHIAEWNGQVQEETTTAGKIYRAWMDVKKTFAASDRQSVLNSCEFGEDAAQNAYEQAIGEEGVLAPAVALITNQKTHLLASHDHVKQLRDQERERVN